jgi:mRNA interferase MazF
MQTSRIPVRGDVWWVDFGTPIGHEQGFHRPALIVSVDRFNRSHYGLHIVLPLTKQDKRMPSHVEIRPPEAGLALRSFIKCEDVRSVSLQRLGRYVGQVAPDTLERAEDRLRLLLGL